MEVQFLLATYSFCFYLVPLTSISRCAWLGLGHNNMHTVQRQGERLTLHIAAQLGFWTNCYQQEWCLLQTV